MASVNMRESMKKRKKNDKGAAMVMVIVAIAFIGMLVAMVLYMSYANYQMKSSDRRSKDNFYTAESVLDFINAGLQKDISDCMARAYVNVTQNSTGMTSDEMTEEFQKKFIEYLTGPDYLGSGVADEYNVKHLENMWKNVVTIAASSGAQGAFLKSDNPKMIVATTNGYVTLEDIHIEYLDNNGYVSVINTDIRIETPGLDFAEATNRMTIENYSIIANDSLVSDALDANSGTATTSITGNIFGGYDGIRLGNQNAISFEIDAADAALLAGGTPVSYNLAAGSINLDNVLTPNKQLKTDEYFRTYVKDINVNTGRISLDGLTYVADDMDISGKNSEVVLSGKYYGYGASYSESDMSSSILINGADTTLDMSNLEELMLSGHAFVGATKYDADKDRQAKIINDAAKSEAEKVTADSLTSDKVSDLEDYNTSADTYDQELKQQNQAAIDAGNPDNVKDSVPQNKSDVMTGESMSVKANQLLYLVPSECVGYVTGTDKQVVTKNPMTYDEFVMLRDTQVQATDAQGNPITNPNGSQKMEQKYEVVRLSELWNKLGGNNYTDSYKAVFRRINGSVMVYLYLDFADEMLANDFYQAYYRYDPTGIANYVSSYVKEITWPNNIKGNSDKLTLAGNAFDYNSTTKELELVEDNNDNDHTDVFLRRVEAEEDYFNKYTALMHSTSDDYTVLTASDESGEIFDNLVEKSLLKKYAGTYKDDTTQCAAEIKYFGDTDLDGKDGDGVITYPDDCYKFPGGTGNSSTHVIITNGDVIVNADFEGLIVAGGTVYIGPGCNSIQYNPTMVINSLRASKGVDPDKEYAYQVFGKDGEVTYALATTQNHEEETAISLVELISYENWKKD